MTTVVVGIVLLTRSSPKASGLLGSEISQSLYGQLSGVSDSTLASVGTIQGVSPLQSISGSPLTSGGKPEFLYVGADYCPFCAAERWSIIVALSKFGTFSGLEYMQSADSPEVYPGTSTFTFFHATYSSQYVAFVSVEEQDRYRQPLQTLTSDQSNLVQQYDTSGGIPFIDIYNQYAGPSGSQYSPSVLSGLNWTQIGSRLNDPTSSIAKSVDGAASTLITAICKVDGGNPSSLCGQSFASLSPFLTSGQPAVMDLLDSLVTTDRTGAPGHGKAF